MRRLLMVVCVAAAAILCSAPRPASGAAVLDVYMDQLRTVQELVSGLTPDLSRGPDQTLRWYLLALVTRNPALCNAVVVPALRAPTAGPSSPWVYRADVKGEAHASPDVWRYAVALGLANSTGPVAGRTETVDVSEVAGRYLITSLDLRRYAP